MRGRIVTAPDGVRWRVGRRWLTRSPPKPWTRWRRKRKLKRAEDLDPDSGILDVADVALTGTDGSAAGLALAAGIVVVIALVVFVLLPLIGIAFELALLIGFVLSGLFGRVVLRRPWTIEAVGLEEPTRRHAFAVVGWRRSRRALTELTAAITAAGPPAALLEAEATVLDPARSST